MDLFWFQNTRSKEVVKISILVHIGRFCHIKKNDQIMVKSNYYDLFLFLALVFGWEIFDLVII